MAEQAEIEVSLQVNQELDESSSVHTISDLKDQIEDDNIMIIPLDEVEPQTSKFDIENGTLEIEDSTPDDDALLDSNVVSSDPVRMEVQNSTIEPKNVLADSVKSVEKPKLTERESVEMNEIESDNSDLETAKEKKKPTKIKRIFNTYICPQCSFASKRAYNFKKHLQIHPKYECDMCEYESTNVNESFLHSITHKKLTNVFTLGNHKKTRIDSKGTEAAFECVMCDYKKANGEAGFNCNLCKNRSSIRTKRKNETTTQPHDSTSKKKTMTYYDEISNIEHVADENQFSQNNQMVKIDEDEKIEQVEEDIIIVIIVQDDEQAAKKEQLAELEQDSKMEQESKIKQDSKVGQVLKINQDSKVEQESKIKQDTKIQQDSKMEQESKIKQDSKVEEESKINQDSKVEQESKIKRYPKMGKESKRKRYSKMEQESKIKQDSKMDQDKIHVDLKRNVGFEPPLWIQGTRNYCNMCEGEIRSKDVFIRHWWNHNMKKFHIIQDYPLKDMVIFECKMCGDKFEKNKFSRHILQHDVFEKFKCNKCEYNTLFKVEYNHHLKIHSRWDAY